MHREYNKKSLYPLCALVDIKVTNEISILKQFYIKINFPFIN